jgi:UDP-2,3-diacylglucosamine hydrolase
VSPRIPAILDVAPMEPPVVVVGDVHLCVEEPDVTERFVAWLDALAGRCATLVMLGDIFDLWVGRPQQGDPLPRAVLPHLARLAQAGTRLIFMPGNRDLLFRGVDGLDLDIWPDPVRTRWAERAVVLTHGDQLCTADHGYQAMRRFLYGPGGRALDVCLPYRAKRWLGDGMRGLSTRETGKKAVAAMDIDYGEALRWLDAFASDLLVAGHVHTGVHHVHEGPPRREVLVLKDWERGGGVVVFDADGVRLERPEQGPARLGLGTGHE